MVNRRLGIVALLAFFVPAPLFAAAGPLAFSVDEETQSYTITEQGQPVLTYRFGFRFRPESRRVISGRATRLTTSQDFTDGSRYGGERSDYVIRCMVSTASRLRPTTRKIIFITESLVELV